MNTEPPTAEEVCRTIELMSMQESFDEGEADDHWGLIYRMTHCRSDCGNPHEDWIAEYREMQVFWENWDKAPADPTKVWDMPYPKYGK